MENKPLIGKNVIEAAMVFESLTQRKPDRIVIDHHICYGRKKALCKQPTGNKGVTCQKDLITCPKCLENLKKRK